MATLSGVHLMSFFAQIEPLLRMARANGCRTYLLAHSMGNLALQSAVENWFLHGNGNAELFNVSILAAADCGFDAFAQPHLTGLDGLSLLSSRVSIYYSGEDEVLDLSRTINGLQRLGQDGPKTVLIRPRFRPPLTECSTQPVLKTTTAISSHPTNIIVCLPLCAMR